MVPQTGTHNISGNSILQHILTHSLRTTVFIQWIIILNSINVPDRNVEDQRVKATSGFNLAPYFVCVCSHISSLALCVMGT